jgi:hypothetical protein
MSSVVSRCLVALLAAAIFPLLCHAASAADGRRPATTAAVKPAPEPTGAEVVGKLLSEQDGPSDPDVPLPQHGLSANQGSTSTPQAGPQVFGRREDNGGVFGLKFPIPVSRSSN